MLQPISKHAGFLCGLSLAVSSALLAFLAAWVDRFDADSLGLSRIRGFGWELTAALGMVVLYQVLARRPVSWTSLAAILLIASLATDQLPLRSLLKSQCTLLLCSLSQWASCQGPDATRTRRVAFALAFFLVGMMIETVYFLALLKGRHFIGVF